MVMSEKDSQLIEQSTRGEITILIAPKDQEFDNGTSSLMIENGEIFTISDQHEKQPAAIKLEEITKRLRDGEWEIRRSF